MNDEESIRNLKMLAMALILSGLAMQFYLLWSEGKEKEVVGAVTSQGLNTLASMRRK